MHKLFTFLGASLLLGTLSAHAYYDTVNISFRGSAEAYKHVTLETWTSVSGEPDTSKPGEFVTLDSNSYQFIATGAMSSGYAYELKADEGYTITATYTGSFPTWEKIDGGYYFYFISRGYTYGSTRNITVTVSNGEEPTPTDSYVTLNFVGEDDLADAYEYVTVTDRLKGTKLPIDSPVYQLHYTQTPYELYYEVEDGYELRLETANPGIIDIDATLADITGGIDVYLYGEAPDASITAYVTRKETGGDNPNTPPTAKHVTFIFNGIDGVESPELCVEFDISILGNFWSVDTNPYYYTVPSTGLMLFVRAKEGYKITSMESDQKGLTIVPPGPYTEQRYNLNGSADAVDGAEIIVNVARGADPGPAYILFNFIGEDGLENAYEHVTSFANSTTIVPVDSNRYKYVLTGVKYEFVEFIAHEGYEVTDLVSDDRFLIVSEPWLYDWAVEVEVGYSSGGKVDIYVAKKSAVDPPAGSSVDLYFRSDDVDNPYQMVSVIDVTNGDDPVMLPISGDSYQYNYSGTRILNYTVGDGYKLTLSTDSEYVVIDDQYVDYGFGYDVYIYGDDANGAEITAIITKDGAQGGEDPDPDDDLTAVAFQFNKTDNGDYTAWEAVDVSYVQWGSTVVTEVEINGDGDIIKVEAPVVFTITPHEGYTITTSFEGSGQAEDNGDGSWEVIVFFGNTETVWINIDVTAKSSGIDTINAYGEDDIIYNLQGVRVNADKLAKGIYVINGKKVVIR